MSTTTTNTTFDDVCAAIRDVHDEASLWHLSDELVRVAPSGVQAVEDVVAEATRRGIPTKSANTLRLYRDVAIRFPAAERVPMVSFSAHREALGGTGDPGKARQVLEDLAKQHGPAGVTVTTVKKAIGAATGKVSTPSVKQVAPATSYEDVARDLCGGGVKFVKELDAMLALDGVTLDGLHSGLSAVLAAVEARRAKAARKAAAAKAPAAKAGPRRQARPSSSSASNKAAAKAAAKAPAKAGAKAGDLRGL